MDNHFQTVGQLSAPCRPELPVQDWRRLNALLARALEVAPEDRPGFIAGLNETERSLAPLLRKLLAGVDPRAVDSPLTALGADALRTARSDRDTSPLDDVPGTQVGPYRLISELGSGGMGTVWLAERTDGTFERQVAIKLPRAEWADRGLAVRMARERAVLASLDHPNIARLLDAGSAHDGRPFLALEYVEGEPIDAWCRRQGLAPAQRVRLFVDVVRAVAFAHAKLVIHRDLKPSNVFITAEGQVKLLDFGIAKLLQAGSPLTEETALTQLSGRALTLNYAAPEQILGKPMGTAAETYSLGVMLFELMTGERPYRLARDSRGALEEAILGTDPPLPSSVVVDKDTARSLRGDLDAIILKALRKQPEQRYETTAAFADDLERWLDQRPVRARRNSGWYRTQRFLVRHRLRVLASAVATTSVLIGSGVALWQSRAAGEEAARADTVKELVLSIIGQADPVASRETRDADLTLLTTAESRLARELGTNPSLALELRLAIAQAYRNRGEFQRARGTLRSAIDEARKSLPHDDLNLMRAWVRMADWQLIDHDDVRRELDDVIGRARLLGRRGAPILVEGLTARTALRHAIPDQARADIREAYEVAVRHFGPSDPIALGVALAMSETQVSLSELLPVIETSYRAASANPMLDATHPKRIQLQSTYGIVLCATGRGREGLELLRAAEVIARKSHGSSLPTEYALAALRVGFEITGDARGSLAAAREALALASAREAPGVGNSLMRAKMLIESAIAARSVDEALPLMGYAEANLAEMPEGKRRAFRTVVANEHRMRLLNIAGDTIGAEDIAEQAVAKAEALGLRPQLRSIRLAWSYALRANGKAPEAERLLVDMPDPKLGEDDEDETFLSEAAAVRLGVGNAQAALELADRALARFQRVRLQVDPALSDLHVTRGQALLKLGRATEAREEFRIAHEFWRSYDATSRWAAEASYWLARALIETGDDATGKSLLRAAHARLATSPIPAHRALARSDI